MSMQTSIEGSPRWASAPGDTIRRVLSSKGLTTEDLADALELSDPQARRLVTGELPVSEDIADRLARTLGSTPQFWQRRDLIYRETLVLLQADEIAKRSPMIEMVKRGWIGAATTDWREQASALMDYFGVKDAPHWSTVWTKRLDAAHYRTSETFESDEISVAAWLRRCEIEASEQPVESFSRDRLHRVIPALRQLTKVGDPQRFLPTARSLLAGTGVALVVLQATKENRLSGAAFKLESGARAIALSARHLSEDHLWFTLFHEIGHLMMHDSDGEFLDLLDDSHDETSLEQEANDFARASLLPLGVEALAGGRANGPTVREITRFAVSAGVAPGIVVGRLHYDGILKFSERTRLIRRYRWTAQGLTQKI